LLRTVGNSEFLLFDGWQENNRILIFASTKCKEFLATSTKWGADGTFSVVPLLFNQIWLIFGRLHRTYVPAVYVLMSNRTEDSYRFVLNKLLEIDPRFQPESVATDFEMAELNAFKV